MTLGKVFLFSVTFLLLLACDSTQESSVNIKKLENEDMKLSYQLEEKDGKTILIGKVSLNRSNDSPTALNVVEEGHRNGTVTNKNGEFKLALKSTESTISIGFEDLTPLRLDLTDNP